MAGRDERLAASRAQVGNGRLAAVADAADRRAQRRIRRHSHALQWKEEELRQ